LTEEGLKSIRVTRFVSITKQRRSWNSLKAASILAPLRLVVAKVRTGTRRRDAGIARRVFFMRVALGGFPFQVVGVLPVSVHDCGRRWGEWPGGTERT